MDTPTRTASPSADDVHVKQASPPPAQDKISAYYSLVFPHFTFYIQTLSITIGRRCAQIAASSSSVEYPQVDVDLGALKSVSRLHAKIEYDQLDDRFVLVVIGRNGAWVDGVWSGAGTRAPLSERYAFEIGAESIQLNVIV
jgi:forkhead box protein K